MELKFVSYIKHYIIEFNKDTCRGPPFIKNI